MFVCQLPKEKQRTIMMLLLKLGYAPETVENVLSSRVKDVAGIDPLLDEVLL